MDVSNAAASALRGIEPNWYNLPYCYVIFKSDIESLILYFLDSYLFFNTSENEYDRGPFASRQLNKECMRHKINDCKYYTCNVLFLRHDISTNKYKRETLDNGVN